MKSSFHKLAIVLAFSLFLSIPSYASDNKINTAIEVIKTGYSVTSTLEPEYRNTNLDNAKALHSVGSTLYTVSTISKSSAAGIMTALSNTGGTVVTGVVGTTMLSAPSAGFGAATILNNTVFSGDSNADQAARVGTYVGATAGTAVSGASLLTCGARPAGLTTIGTALGGGMAKGAIVVVAAPVAAAAAVGAFFYWMFGD